MFYFSIFDRLVGEYGVPFMAHNEADAKRKCAIAYRDNMAICDLLLYQCGQFDVSDGLFYCPDKPECLGEMTQIVSDYFNGDCDHE